MDSSTSNPETWELGRIYLRQCDLENAKTHLTRELEARHRARDLDGFSGGLPILLRLLAEEMAFAEIGTWIAKLRELLPEGSESSHVGLATDGSAHGAAIDYTVGISEIYQGRRAEALICFMRAQRKATLEGNRRIALQAEFGSWGVKSQSGLHDEVLRGLALFISKIPAEETELRIAANVLRAVAAREMNRPLEASALLDQAEALAQEQMNLFMIANIFYARGALAEKLGETDKALSFLELAQSLSENRSLKHLKVQVDRKIAVLRPAAPVKGLFLIESPEAVHARWGTHEVSFRGQELLVELLKLFMEHKDSGLDKETIVKNVWKEEYDPRVHDNKIYVTVHRLKRLLKNLGTTSPSLLKNQKGYRLNPVFFTQGGPL